MTKIAFIGLGNMGAGMCANLAKAGHQVRAFDLNKEAVAKAQASGAEGAASVAEAVPKSSCPCCPLASTSSAFISVPMALPRMHPRARFS